MYALFTTKDIFREHNLSIDLLASYSVEHSHKEAILFLGEDKKNLLDQIQKQSFVSLNQKPLSHDITFLFTGQGSQGEGMFTPWMHVDSFNKALIDLFENDENKLNNIIEHSQGDSIHQTQHTQPALFAFEWAMSQVWKDLGIHATTVLGHSVGEYPAFSYAHGINPKDGLTLISKRALLMSQLQSNGAMLAIKSDQESLTPYITPYLNISIAALNAPNQVVLSGDEIEIDQLSLTLSDHKVRNQKLQVSVAFHSHHLDPMLNELNTFANSFRHHSPQIPIFSNLTGDFHFPTIPKDYWGDHARSPVMFQKSIQSIAKETTFIEMGPQPILSNLVKRMSNMPCYPSTSLKTPYKHFIATCKKLIEAGHRFKWDHQTTFDIIIKN